MLIINHDNIYSTVNEAFIIYRLSNKLVGKNANKKKRPSLIMNSSRIMKFPIGKTI